ncbi:hypothetical protein BDR26DRAFT_458637 [Obelidium mucronatum]|nr:hypothetical protein BDR26DRAFT_458637 [Obelidium mucronatum]
MMSMGSMMLKLTEKPSVLICWFVFTICFWLHALSSLLAHQHYTILPENENMEFLKCLAFLTAVHEIQHFVHSQLKVDSPSQPIVGRTPPIESGDEWEFRNILGIIGIGSAPGSMYTVTGLYLNRGATSPFVSTNYIQQMMEVLAGTRNFPLMEDPLLWTPDVSGIIRRKRKLLCHDKMSCDMANDEYGPDLMIRRTRPSDKKIRK